MPKSMFERIFKEVVIDNDFLRAGLRPDATGKLGAAPLQKVVASMRYIVYGTPADGLDEYCRLGESTTLESMKQFCRSVVRCFGRRYLRSPTTEDLQTIEKQFAGVGFPGCMGCLDCAGWEWGMCPKGMQGIMNGKEKVPTLRMEVISDMNLYIWHLCFGFPGSMNDLNILSVSPHFADVLSGSFPPTNVEFEIAGEKFDWLYYLTDGVYPNYKIFISTIAFPNSKKVKRFARLQEGARKSVERVFGVLFRRFALLHQPSRLWFSESMLIIMQACCCMHNMLVELRKEWFVGDGIGGVRSELLGLGGNNEQHESTIVFTRSEETEEDILSRLQQVTSIPSDVKDVTKHMRLRNALVDHIDDKFSN